MKSGPKPRPALDRFLARIEKKQNGCWIYGGREDIYGQIQMGDKSSMTAHRFSFEHFHQKIRPGLFVCHKCDVKGCVNPEHLYEGTHEDNTSDIVDRKRNQSNNHARVGKIRPVGNRFKNGRVLSPDMKQRMKAEYESGRFTQMELAKRYRVSQAMVSKVARGQYDEAYRPSPNGGQKRTGFFRRKMQPETYLEVYELYKTGEFTQMQLAEKFNCTQTHISKIVHQLHRGN